MRVSETPNNETSPQPKQPSFQEDPTIKGVAENTNREVQLLTSLNALLDTMGAAKNSIETDLNAHATTVLQKIELVLSLFTWKTFGDAIKTVPTDVLSDILRKMKAEVNIMAEDEDPLQCHKKLVEQLADSIKEMPHDRFVKLPISLMAEANIMFFRKIMKNKDETYMNSNDFQFKFGISQMLHNDINHVKTPIGFLLEMRRVLQENSKEFLERPEPQKEPAPNSYWAIKRRHEQLPKESGNQFS